MSTQPTAISGEPSVGAIADVVDPEIVYSPTTVDEPVEPDTSAQPEAATESGAQPEETLESKEDGRKLPPYVRDLKDKNPEAFKRAKSEFFDLTARRSVHPTVQAAREEHDLIASSGGVQGIAKLREDGQVFRNAAQQFLKGDPGFVKDLFDEDPIAAALHVQPFLDLYREKDAAGYKSTVAQLWATEFNAVGFENGLKNLLAAISAGDKETALHWGQQFQKWQESISGVARQAEDPRVKTLLAERAKQHETREQTERQEFLKSYRADALNGVIEDGGKTFDSFFKGRKIEAEDRNDLLREAFAMTSKAVELDKEFMAQREKHLAHGDAQAAVKMTRARFAREMPTAVKRIARRYGMFSGPAKPAPAIGGQPAPKTQPNAPQGFIKVNARPTAEAIDRSKTTADMIIAGRAILKNGRKEDWSHLKRSA